MSNLFKLPNESCIFYKQGHGERLLTNEIPIETRAVLYICKVNPKKLTIEVIQSILFDRILWALEAYANIRNPESQLVTAKSYDELCEKLNALHVNMKSRKWVEELLQCI